VQLEGVRGLYKGLSGPLLTGGLCNGAGDRRGAGALAAR
jgi:hypothetical protein